MFWETGSLAGYCLKVFHRADSQLCQRLYKSGRLWHAQRRKIGSVWVVDMALKHGNGYGSLKIISGKSNYHSSVWRIRFRYAVLASGETAGGCFSALLYARRGGTDTRLGIEGKYTEKNHIRTASPEEICLLIESLFQGMYCVFLTGIC